MQKIKIVLFKFYNQYESKRYFVTELAKALTARDIEVLVIEPEGGIFTMDDYQRIVLFDPDFTFSFNTIQSDSKGKFICDYLEIPHCLAIVDPAFYALDLAASPFAFFTSVDKEDCSWFLEQGISKISFWPHAVEKCPPISINQKKIFDVVFLGTCTDFEALKCQWQKKLNPQEIQILESAIQKMLRPPLKHLAKTLNDTYLEQGSPVPFDFKTVFYYLDNYIRGKDRFELISSIKNADVHLFGEPSWNNPNQSISWSALLNKKNIKIHPPVSYKEAFNVMAQSKVCLNSSPFFKSGSHERILNAFMAGALPLTTHNGYVEEFFSPGKDLMTYKVGEWDQVNEELDLLLASNDLREDRIAIGKDKVLQKHTWDHRALELLNIFDNRAKNWAQ